MTRSTPGPQNESGRLAQEESGGPEESGRLRRKEGQEGDGDERQLLPRHRTGDRSAFPDLVARYRAPVYGYLARTGVAAEARDDLFQEIFLKIHKAAWSYQPERPLHPWVFTIVANTVRSHYRRHRVRQLVYAEPGGEDAASPGADSQQLLEADELAGFVDRALGSLPRAQREVLVLCCIEQLPQRDVADVLGLPLNTVKTHLRRGRLALARALADRHTFEEKKR
jgi:RNA polymerase sigma-70 factor (ECF subfamily)